MTDDNTTCIFGYGSLMNEESHTKTVGDMHRDLGFYNLKGYERIFNLNYDNWVFLNIQPKEGSSIYGNVIEVTQEGLDELLEREVGYELVDITDSLEGDFSQPVYTFIAPPQDPRGVIKQSYINKCLKPLDQSIRKQWLDDSIVISAIEPDAEPIEM